MLKAISPIDGRYADKTTELSNYFSEFALIRYRVLVEVEYLVALAGKIEALETFDTQAVESLRRIYLDFSEDDASAVKQTERTTNHDVKAVEYFVKDKLDTLGMAHMREWVHFGLTSQDINNTATPLLVKGAVEKVMIPQLDLISTRLRQLTDEWLHVPMLAHTHGQPASPTTVGKELRVFVERLDHQVEQLRTAHHFGKFGGATGNFNAHVVAFPDAEWKAFGDDLLRSMGLHRIQTSTQIDHYDHLATVLHACIRCCSILIDLCRDVWSYISMEYFKQKTVAGEVGSSTMPHKVNPIDFENAEGNLGLAIALFDHLAIKLPVSRLQRDLTDSTVLRNVGVPFAHMLIALKSIGKGIDKLQLNREKLEADLTKNWLVVGEAIQTILRREGVANPYELLKDLTRGNSTIDQESMNAFIDNLDVGDHIKDELKHITPHNYLGYSDR